MIAFPTKEELLEFRSQGDISFGQVLATYSHKDLQVIWTLGDDVELAQLVKERLFERLAPYCLTLPIWSDQRKLDQSEVFFEEYLFDLMLMLGLVSLPYCYGGADGSKVLTSSKRITDNIQTRLMETGGFVMDVCGKGAFSGNGKGFLSCLKVRMIHEFIRQKLLNSNWDINTYGYPINQLDQAGTNLSFSLIALRAMKKTGIKIENSKADSYLHRWNVISSLIGLNDSLITDQMKIASQLALKIEQCQFRYSQEGETLTKTLLKFLQTQDGIGAFGKILPLYMAYLLGPKLSSYVGLKDKIDVVFEMNGLYNQLKQYAQWLPDVKSIIKNKADESSNQGMKELPFLIEKES